MTTKNDGGPAFPPLYHPMAHPNCPPGMSLRDWFAGKAISMFTGDLSYMQRLHNNAGVNLALDVDKLIARNAYQIADAMMAERAK